MRIIIVGAGKIGTNLAKDLAEENHEVYLIENDEDVAILADEKVDAKVIVGNGADPDTLIKVQVREADLVLAVTTSDETNLVVCSLAASFGAKRRIARVRSTSLSRELSEFGYKLFHIDEIINPELVAAQSIVKTIEAPGTCEVGDFANGRILLRAFDVPKKSPLCGSKLQDFRDDDFPWPFLIISIVRDHTVLIPVGDTVVEEDDRIYVLLPTPSLGEFLTFIDPEIRKPKKVIIYGATITGENIAMDLEESIRDLILIEEDPDKAEDAAGRLESTKIIHGSGSEKDILTECGIEAADVFIAASSSDNSNLVSAVLAKKMGAKTTMITTQQPDYLSLVEALDIDVIVNAHVLAIDQILRLVRGKGVSAVTKLLECDAEALELVPEEGSKITKAPLKDIKMPQNTIVGAIYRKAEVVLATGDTHIQPGERVIVFCQESAVKKLQTMFTKKKLI